MNEIPASTPPPALPLEVWGGVECSYHRLYNEYYDQLRFSGHLERLEDLDLFAALGLRAIRYPVQWERVAPRGLEHADWAWTDARLLRLRELGIRPIAALVHHGSGPRGTSLTDASFATGLVGFARAVAERYPWLADYTPVNEPLTTARFSGLYGHWHPHERDPKIFGRVLVNQCRAIALATRAVRSVNPGARLVQTEDIGKVYSTPRLSYQADFENERRWLTFDLLSGRVDRAHPMWGYMHDWCGIPEADLAWFGENPCPPDVLGIDYYITSERYLDHRLSRYPGLPAPGNHRERYVDIEAVRVCREGIGGVGSILKEAWHRYRIPLAVTEAHLGCTREEQMRWLHEIWATTRLARRDGVDVRAVTAWSLLGASDWDSLLTQMRGHYEPGVFDVRNGTPRATALAGMLRAFASGEHYRHPVLANPGWWHRPERLLYPPARRGEAGAGLRRRMGMESIQPAPILITGAGGALAGALIRACVMRGLAFRATSRADADIADADAVEETLERIQPWAVVNAAGFARVHEAERRPVACYRDNAQGAEVLAKACARRGLPLVTFSTDLVFGGNPTEPYLESDRINPMSVYGRSKAEAERRALENHPAALVVRSGPFFGPWDGANFLTRALAAAFAGRAFFLPDDHAVSPAYLPDLANAVLDLLLDGEAGLWHLANPGAASFAGTARLAAEMAGLDAGAIQGRSGRDGRESAPMPAFSALGTERGALLPRLEDTLARYVADRWANVEGARPFDEEVRLEEATAEEALEAEFDWRP